MLGSYTDFDPDSSQYKWLQGDLQKIDRGMTPWVVVLIHAPWYNSNTAHQGEPESVNMKADMEDLLYQARVDVVFAGHVHAYERFTRVYKDKGDNYGSVYITIGDGGNREGLATNYTDPQPEISIFREASFGHGILEVLELRVETLERELDAAITAAARACSEKRQAEAAQKAAELYA